MRALQLEAVRKELQMSWEADSKSACLSLESLIALASAMDAPTGLLLAVMTAAS